MLTHKYALTSTRTIPKPQRHPLSGPSAGMLPLHPCASPLRLRLGPGPALWSFFCSSAMVEHNEFTWSSCSSRTRSYASRAGCGGKNWLTPKWLALVNGTKDKNVRSNSWFNFDPYPALGSSFSEGHAWRSPVAFAKPEWGVVKQVLFLVTGRL